MKCYTQVQHDYGRVVIEVYLQQLLLLLLLTVAVAVSVFNTGITVDWGNTFTDKSNFDLLLHEGIRNKSHARI